MERLEAFYRLPEVDTAFVLPLSRRNIAMHEILHPDGDHLRWVVATCNKRIVGARRVLVTDDVARLSYFAVLPELRGWRIGSRIYKTSVEVAQSFEPRRIWLKTWSTSERAISMALRYGFRQTREYPEDIRPDGVTTLEFELC